MSKKSKLNQFALSLTMGLIVIAFVFTGVQGFTNSAGQVASVDGTKVSVEEYQRSLDQTLNYWTQINKGKSLTQKEIRERGIREQVLDQLINNKVMLNYAKSLGFGAGAGNIKYTLMNQYKEFQTNGKFDVSKYKAILKANNISFKKFEEGMLDQVKLFKLDDLLSAQQVSRNYLSDITKYRSQKAVVAAASFRKEEMTKNLEISKDEINEFLAQDSSKVILNSLYDTYKQENLAKAKSFDVVKSDLAAKHLKRKKRNELKEFNEKLTADLKEAFEKNQWNKVQLWSKKYGFDFNQGAEVNLFNASIPTIELEEEKVRKLFKDKDTDQVLVKESPIQVSLVKAKKFESKQDPKEDMKQMMQMSNNMLSRSLNYQILQTKREKADVTRNSSLFQ